MTSKRTIALAIITTLLSLHIPLASAAPLPFPDMEWSWYRYRDAVQELVDRGVIGGYPDGLFHPKDTINRAELLKIVFSGKSSNAPVGRRCFSDVNPDAWYAPYVCAAKNRGIVQGYPNGTFRPGEPVNIAEAVKIILHAYGHDVKEGKGEAWYAPYIRSLDDDDILDADSVVPWETLNRERAADLLWRVLQFDDERIVPRLSPGCGKAAPVSPPSSVRVFDQQRDFLLTVPRTYVTHDPSPLIVAFHGRTNDNGDVRSYYRLDQEMTDAFIAYPAALPNGSGFSWANPGDSAAHPRDLLFFDAIVERLANTYCIDMNRIFVVGHSLGGWMANTVACLRGDVVRSSASIGGDGVLTDCAGPAAGLIAHNPKDTLAPFSGSERIRQQRVEDNACSWDVENDKDFSALNCVRHATCAGQNPVLWCPHTINNDSRGTYYPHNWPSSMATLITRFFQELK